MGDGAVSETVKHTPGPWRVDDSVHGPNEGIIHVRAGEYSNPEICTLWASSLIMKAGDDWLAENYANARLIAAAPELLEAGAAQTDILRKAQSILTQYLIGQPKGLGQADAIAALLGLLDGQEQRAAQAKWDTAIAKAEGRS